MPIGIFALGKPIVRIFRKNKQQNFRLMLLTLLLGRQAAFSPWLLRGRTNGCSVDVIQPSRELKEKKEPPESRYCYCDSSACCCCGSWGDSSARCWSSYRRDSRGSDPNAVWPFFKPSPLTPKGQGWLALKCASPLDSFTGRMIIFLQTWKSSGLYI